MNNQKFMFPTKPGGGNLPQPYDPKNGEYVNYSNDEILRLEIERVQKFLRFNIRNIGYEGHFPTFGFHNDEYNKLFVEAYRTYFKPEIIQLSKMEYLLSKKIKDNKNDIFISAGYSINSLNELRRDIFVHSDFKKSIYNNITKYGLSIFVPTKIRDGKNIVTVWMFDNSQERKLKFVTALTKRSKYEKLFQNRG